MLKFTTLIVLMFIFISCQKELNFDDPGSVPLTTSTGCKSCSYVPFCDGTIYTYIDTTGTGSAGVTSIDSIKIIKDTIIDGKTYQKFANPGADGYYNCTNGVSKIIAYGVPATGGTVLKIEQTLLKANEPVGATWVDSLDNGLGQAVQYTSKIIAKGISRTVLGVTYNNVIHVHQTIGITVPVIGSIVMAETDNYFANNIGLIDNITFQVNPFGGQPTMTLHRVLKNYLIP